MCCCAIAAASTAAVISTQEESLEAMTDPETAVTMSTPGQ